MLSVPTRPPPVPQVSTSPSASSTSSRTIAPRSARAAPATSSAVSPSARSPIRSAAVCTGVASPRITTANAAAAASLEREAPWDKLVEGMAERSVLGHGRSRSGPRRNGAGSVEKSIRERPLLSIVTSSCAACPGGLAPLDFGPMSRTFLATLHFDGTGFVGWQRQAAGRSVQAEFERVLERLFGTPRHSPRRRPHRCRRACGRPRRQLPRPRQLDWSHPAPGAQRPAPARLLGRAGAMRCGRASTRGRARSPAAIATTSAPTTRRPRRSAGHSSGRSAGRSIWPRSGRPPPCCTASTTSRPSPPRASPSRTTAAGCAIAEWAERPDGPRHQLSRRGRPLPAPHGPHAGRHDGGRRPRPPPARRHRDAARARRQPADQPAGPAAGTLLRGRRRILRSCSCRAGEPACRRRRSCRSPMRSRSRSLLALVAAACRDVAAAPPSRARARGHAMPVASAGAQVAAARTADAQAINSRRTALVAAVERASGAVVSINVTSTRRGAGRARPGTSSSSPKARAWCRATAPASSSARTASSSPTSTWWPTPTGSS